MIDERALNEKQCEAVTFGEGPLLIIAGAGTGKTTVITERIRHLIIDKNVPPQEILALTFTEKAAYEMEERIDILLPYGYTNLWISTFHSFCDRILRQEAHFVGLDSGYILLSESEATLFLRQHIFDLGLKLFLPLGNPTKFIGGLLTHFSRLADESITPEDYIGWTKEKEKSAKTQEEKDALEQFVELAQAYKKYSELKIKNSFMDFSDLITNTLKLFRERPAVLKRYQNHFQYILVDEFQDTNFAQNELAMLLCNNKKNLNVVADDDQSIYRFRGAAVSNVLQFKTNFPEAKIITLTDNYRSSQTILDASYNLIQHNNPNRLEVVENINKKLVSHTKNKEKEIIVLHATKAEDEAEQIAENIIALTKKQYTYNDVAILVRANNHAQSITNALSRKKIPYQFLGPGYLFQQEEIKDLIAYLTFLTNLSDTVSLFRVLSMDIFHIDTIELNYLLNFAKKKNASLFAILREHEIPNISDETKEKLEKFYTMVKRHLQRVKRDLPGQILYYFLVDSGLYETLQKVNSLKKEQEVQNIAKFFDRVKKFETDTDNATIFTLVEYLLLMMQMGDSPTAAEIDLRNNNAVNILTVHSAKGLEFPVVFLVNLVKDRFPTRERQDAIPLPDGIIKEKMIDADFHKEEERRLFYVGMTRAKELLYLTAADYYGTGKRAKKLSPFIFEALPNFSEQENAKQKTKQLTLGTILSTYENADNEIISEKTQNKKPLTLTYITYSNLQMFAICPLHFKAKVLLNLPTPATAAQSFGISLHATLFAFYKKMQNGEKPTFADLLAILKKEWINEGYVNKQHETERFDEATKLLENFYKTASIEPIVPLALELPFSFPLKNGVKVFGKIDRIDATPHGIEIIDYKTGQDNPKAEKSYELQLAIYALAATRVKDPIFHHDPQDITVTLYFLEGNTKRSLHFSKEDLEKLENTLLEKIKEIENSDFVCSKSVLCVTCEYKMLCNAIS